MAELWVFAQEVTADQYYCVYFCMLEEPAIVKPLSYSSEFVSILDTQLVTQFKQSKFSYVNGCNGLNNIVDNHVRIFNN